MKVVISFFVILPFPLQIENGLDFNRDEVSGIYENNLPESYPNVAVSGKTVYTAITDYAKMCLYQIRHIPDNL